MLSLEQKTVIAALLHDIGKIAERLGKGGNHAELTKEVLTEITKDKELAEIAYGHHHGRDLNTLDRVGKHLRSYAEIVCQADNVSSAAEREIVDKRVLEEWVSRRDRRRRPLLSILSTIDIGKGVTSDKYFYVRELTLHPYYLRPKTLNEAGVDYGFFDKLKKDLKVVFNSNMDFKRLLFTLFHILKKYTFFVPADTFDRMDGKIPIPDTSLYEHLRLTSMFSYTMLVNRNEFILVQGDISGLQNFLARISSKKALRFLKGRSFFLELANLAAALRICKDLRIPPTQILSATAGNFTILAPATEEIEEKLSKLAATLNKELVNLGLYIALAWVRKSYENAKDFERVIEEVEKDVEEKKMRKFAEIIESNYEEVLFPDKRQEKELTEVCDVCDSLIGKNEIEKIKIEEEELKVCKRCKEIYVLSQKLVNVARLVRESEKAGKKANIYIGVCEDGSGDVKIFGIGFKIDCLPENLVDADYILTVNDVDFLERNFIESGAGCGFRFFNVHVEDTSLDELADSSKGAKYIGILKMDGDDMGKVFGTGIKKWLARKLGKNENDLKELGRMTPSRYATLSSLLEIFFGFCVNEICRKGKFFTDEKFDKEPQVYVVFSGGDDMLILGPWNQIVELAIKIQEEFAIFTSNPNFTISAAITVVRKKFPVYRSYFATIESLEDAKSEYEDVGKSAVSIFGEKLRFDDMRKAKELKDYLLEQMESGKLSRSLLFALLNCLDSGGKYRKKWAAKYVIARFSEMYKNADLKKLDNAVDNAFNSGNFSDLLVSIRWVELLTREGVKDES
ncbi:type III-A CRISPR-associated protein Cas10/Csm1 [Archaeoglobus sp.]